MTCTITATESLNAYPFDPPIKGGRVRGSVKFSASCPGEELAKPEVQFNESQSWLDRLVSLLIGHDVYSVRPDVVDAMGGKHGSATIEGVAQVNANLVDVSFNVETKRNGAQSFKLKLKCRCSPTGPWNEAEVAVSFIV